MSPRIKTLSVGWPVAESRGGETGRWVCRSGRGRGPRGSNVRLLNDHCPTIAEPLTCHFSSGYSYKELLACNPNEYDSKGGVVVLTRWVEKMNFLQDMSGCSIDQKVKYITSSFMEDFCPSHEMQKLETELWNQNMVEAGHAAYTERFHELARLDPYLVTPKSRKIKRYVYVLALQSRGMVAATKLKTLQKTVQISGALINEAVRNVSIKKVEKR
ncbi:hypothetical protein Tco_0118917, partial [Tanacetum coccineum]